MPKILCRSEVFFRS